MQTGHCHSGAVRYEHDSGIAPQYHIFTGSKAPWYVIRVSLPQYERGREEA